MEVRIQIEFDKNCSQMEKDDTEMANLDEVHMESTESYNYTRMLEK